MKKIISLATRAGRGMTTKFFLRVFLFQIAMIIGLKIWGVNYISDEMTLGAMVYISVLIGIYTTEKIKTNGKTDSKSKK